MSSITYVDTNGIAAILGISHRYVRDVVMKQPWFPRPVINLSQRMRRWDQEAVLEACSNNKVAR